ncbi:MAG: nucleotidyltransferase family protein [Planctomycetota bacterium]
MIEKSNPKFDLSLGKEWAVLEAIAAGPEQLENSVFLDTVFASEIDWEEIVFQARRHKVLNLLGKEVLARPAIHFPPESLGLFREQLRLSQQKIRTYRLEAARIAESFDNHGLVICGTKGIVFEGSYYDGGGSRSLNDMDFIIKPESADAAKALMESQGYCEGEYNAGSESIIPLDRKQKIAYKLSPDHLPPLVKIVEEDRRIGVVVDFAFTLSWWGAPYRVLINDVIDELYLYQFPDTRKLSIHRMSFRYEFLAAVLHLFREAWFEHSRSFGLDVTLAKFGDILRMWRRVDDRRIRELREVVDRYDLAKPVAWVMEHVDRLFFTDATSQLGLTSVADPVFLNSAHEYSGGTCRWIGTMRQRLYCKNRAALFPSSLSGSGVDLG